MTWPPGSESDLDAALRDGLLDEAHGLDVKQAPPAPGAGGSREIAVDLASLAVDGGHIIYGVREENGRPVELTPFETKGAKERIDQIALSGRIDPPLTVAITEVPAEQAPHLGYVIVTVPSSPLAPHMVDERYRGRGDTTNRVLSAAEVVRLHERRRSQEDLVGELLDTMIAEDPIESPKWARMFVVANPAFGQGEMFYNNVGPVTSWQNWFHLNVLRGDALGHWQPRWDPDLSDQMHIVRHPDGWEVQSGLASVMGDEDLQGTFDRLERHLISLVVTEEGQVRMFAPGVTADRSRGSDQPYIVANEAMVMGLTKRTVLAARTVGRAMSYAGRWDLGLSIVGLQGARSMAASNDIMAAPVRYPVDTYRRTTAATTFELEADVDPVVRRLSDRFCRGINNGEFSRPPG